jgi:hypothetical protein
MAALGRGFLDTIGGPMRALRREGAAAAREISFVVDNLEELGLTSGQVVRAVRDGIVPQLLDMAISAAEAVGDTDAANDLREQQAEIERDLAILQLEVWTATLEAAGAMNDRIRTIIDDTIERLERADTTIRDRDDDDPPDLVAFGGELDRIMVTFAGDEAALKAALEALALATFGASGGVRTLADIIAELEADARTPLEALEFRFAALRDEIADAFGTAEERALALALAEEALAAARQELIDQGLEGLRALQAELNAQLASGQSQRQQVISAREAFGAARAGVDLTDPASVDAFEAAARQYLATAGAYNDLLGGGFGAGLTDVQEEIAAILAQVLGDQGALPAALPGADTGASLAGFAAPSAPLPGPAPIVVAPRIEMGSGFADLGQRVDALHETVRAQDLRISAALDTIATTDAQRAGLAATRQRGAPTEGWR